MGIQNVSFTGGEVLIRKDIFEIIEYARKLYMRVFLLSNGTLLTDNIVARLQRFHITEFSTTLFSMNCDVHDSITRKKRFMGESYGWVITVEKILRIPYKS